MRAGLVYYHLGVSVSANVIDVFESVVKKVLASDELAEALRIVESAREHFGEQADTAKPEPLPVAEAPAPALDAKDAEIAALKAQLAEQQAPSSADLQEQAAEQVTPPVE